MGSGRIPQKGWTKNGANCNMEFGCVPKISLSPSSPLSSPPPLLSLFPFSLSPFSTSLPFLPCPICGKAACSLEDCWCNIPCWDEANKLMDKSKGKDGKDKTSTNKHPAAVEQSQEECEVLELQRSRTLFQRLSKEEAELVGCGESGATIIWCDWRDEVERMLLECHKRLPPESARVRSGKQQILGRNYGRQSRRIEHTSRASQEELHEPVRHVCCWTSCRVRLLVFNFESNKRGLSHAENKLIGERTYFKLRNRVGARSQIHKRRTS